MKVLMLGWEFPPHITGGLGTACHGLTKGLDEVGVEVAFVLPMSVPTGVTRHVKLRSPANLQPIAPAAATVSQKTVATLMERVSMHRVPALLQPYATPEMFNRMVRELLELRKTHRVDMPMIDWDAISPLTQPVAEPAAPGGTFVPGAGAHYAGDLMSQVYRYASLAVAIAKRETFDVVHAHDWMTYPAGMAVAAATGKPLIVHVHSTEFDRSGENVNQQIYDIERAGMHAAACAVCVSHLTRNIALARYGVPPEKTEVVYNAVELPPDTEVPFNPIRRNEKIVLFLGRLTMQKGPEYFLAAAKKVVEKYQRVRFIMAGSGDMVTRLIRMAADLRIGKYVTFTGFLKGDDVAKVFRMADLYVMPSVSEPFGISPLEALSHNVPVIISKQSGVSEVLTHVLKVDFWDTDEMANKILAVLRHAPLQRTLRQHGQFELQKLSWRDSAAKLKDIYSQIVSAADN